FLDGSSGASIGGTSPADRNVISGNSVIGVNVDEVVIIGIARKPRSEGARPDHPATTSGSSSISITGSYIGTNASLTGPIVNATGVFVCDTCSSIAIGSSTMG